MSSEKMKYGTQHTDVAAREGIGQELPSSTYVEVHGQGLESCDSARSAIIYAPECTFIIDTKSASQDISSQTAKVYDATQVPNPQEGIIHYLITSPGVANNIQEHSIKLTSSVDSGVEKALFCYECKISYDNKNGYLRHMLQFHAYTCVCCNKQFLSKFKLRKHIKLQQNANIRKKKTRLMITSRKRKQPLEPRSFYEPKCVKKSEIKKPKSVVKRVKVDSNDRFACDMCNQVFLSRETCKQHKAQIHWRGNTCTMCGKILSSQATLQYHMRGHMGLRPFACDQCDQRFTTNNVLKNHVLLCHSTEEEQDTYLGLP